jgi:hypothetical protein
MLRLIRRVRAWCFRDARVDEVAGDLLAPPGLNREVAPKHRRGIADGSSPRVHPNQNIITIALIFVSSSRLRHQPSHCI